MKNSLDSGQLLKLASSHKLESGKLHQGSDGTWRVFLTRDLSSSRYLQAMLSFNMTPEGHAQDIQSHVGLYAQRKELDDGFVRDYESVADAVVDVASRFDRLKRD